MSDNPFSSKPTIVDEVEEDDDESISTEVQEDYDEIDTTGEEVEDDEDKADEEWAQTPTGLYGELDQEKFWWVFVSIKDGFTENEGRRGIPVVEERFDSYEDLKDAREETDKETPEGIHVQSKGSSKIRYVKGEDQSELLERRGIQ